MIPFKKLNLGNAYKEIKPLFDNGMIGNGGTVKQLELELAEYVGADHVICVSSCTAALFLSLEWEALKGVKTVSLPSMTFCLAAVAAIRAGMKVILNEDTNWVGSNYKILNSVVVDSAHEIKRNSYLPGTHTCYSFYPTKTLGSADGGAIATNDSQFAEWVRSVSVYGRKDASGKTNSWEYDVELLGNKFNYNNLQAAIVLEQLRRLDKTQARYQEINNQYNKALGYENNSSYLYRINVKDRDNFIYYMHANGVECGVHFKPLHLMEPFKNLEVINKEAIEEAYKTTVSLPFYDLLTEIEIDTIIALVINWNQAHA